MTASFPVEVPLNPVYLNKLPAPDNDAFILWHEYVINIDL